MRLLPENPALLAFLAIICLCAASSGLRAQPTSLQHAPVLVDDLCCDLGGPCPSCSQVVDPDRIRTYLFLTNPSGSPVGWNYTLCDFDGNIVESGPPFPADIPPYGTYLHQIDSMNGGGVGRGFGQACFPGLNASPCHNLVNLVLQSDSPVRAHVVVAVEGTELIGSPVEGTILRLLDATHPGLIVPHAAWHDAEGGAASSTRWPVLFLQNPDPSGGQLPAAEGCIELYEGPLLVWSEPFSIPPNGTLAFEPWDDPAFPARGDGTVRRFSLEVDTTRGCGGSEAAGGAVAGTLLTFDGPDWDIGPGASQPRITGTVYPLGGRPASLPVRDGERSRAIRLEERGRELR